MSGARLLWALFVAVALLIAWPALNGQFLSDDLAIMHWLLRWDAAGAFWSSIFAKFGAGLDVPSHYYRPLALITYGLDQRLFGWSPLPWHLTGYAIHIANAMLVGAVMLQRPELFNAVVCQVPLLDMRRYHRLLAGASWMAEYGNPDLDTEWAWIAGYSPYQKLLALPQGQALPQVLFTTSTRDDRVHPGHARKMAARMLALGHGPLYFENTEGGHAGAADNRQKADMLALEYAFLWQALGEAAPT